MRSIIKKPLRPWDKERIDQEKERLKAEPKVYLKNIAFVDRL